MADIETIDELSNDSLAYHPVIFPLQNVPFREWIRLVEPKRSSFITSLSHPSSHANTLGAS